MRTRGADLVVRALEDGGTRFTFGIPGTHNIELLSRAPVATTFQETVLTRRLAVAGAFAAGPREG